MKSIESFFSESQIIRQICKMRIKLASSRSKKHLLHLLTTDSKYNYHLLSNAIPRNEFENYQYNLSKELNRILPSRKKWVKLGEKSRRKHNNKNEFLTSNDKNFYALIKTIELHKRKKSNAIWFISLMQLVREIQQAVSNKEYNLSPPIIVPKLKNKLNKSGKNECRPICMFNFSDRIVLSIVNKFLTQLFDSQFQDTSYAFRSKKRNNQIISHHNCIEDILEYLGKKNKGDVFVVECDMKKFYDTVNHKIILKKFDEIVNISKKQYPELDMDFAILVFNSYLNCFCFNINMPKSTDKIYWDSYNISNGYFGWIGLDDLNIYYQDYSRERIGVPQGGALSGLIANMYLNQVDLKLANYSDIFYGRFCDDMIIIADSFNECMDAKNSYVSVLHELKLFPHTFKDDIELIDFDYSDNIYYKDFWKGKSKGPYKWGAIKDIDFPWIGFVGYEINYVGDIRIRKSSLEKELQKQKKVVNDIKKAIRNGARKSKGSVLESAINRLIGMSVGRIGLDNFEEVSTDLCWKNGFKLLDLNTYSLKQIKKLDRNRNKHYYDLMQFLDDKFVENNVDKTIFDIEETERISETSNNVREILQYNKPFSYYYQILERSEQQQQQQQQQQQ
ncbi:hypothetical protein HX052_15335 [Myroides marinus]|uniref:reverse transcriptase domain-containing protein n=1 Tax=Myroides marinus TaxID=703342 RepID=UPI0025771D7B|nr:reverse transcriptase domain-containing protein [Myroides marinus]MDM1391321.1 hypothetical protein [Myroides marinus]